MQCSLRQSVPLQRQPAAGPASLRSGFSLIELMAVIVIIALLAGLLLPAIGNVRRTARVAQVTTEIKNLEAAIATFKLKYGIEPPSSFVISNNLSDYSTLPAGRSSLTLMGQLWPDYKPATGAMPGDQISASTSGLTFPIQLNGAECLVFFLGGPQTLFNPGDPTNIQNAAPTGFSSNPSTPFSSGGTRVGPFFEFDVGRLVDLDSDGAPELLDPLPGQTTPYQYLSSYQGSGYKVTLDSYSTPTAQAELLPQSVRDNITLSTAYFQTTRGTSPNITRVYWNPKGFQIISPGFDGEFGETADPLGKNGGCFREGSLFSNLDGKSTRISSKENDNITNFSGGMLVPR